MAQGNLWYGDDEGDVYSDKPQVVGTTQKRKPARPGGGVE